MKGATCHVPSGTACLRLGRDFEAKFNLDKTDLYGLEIISIGPEEGKEEETMKK